MEKIFREQLRHQMVLSGQDGLTPELRTSWDQMHKPLPVGEFTSHPRLINHFRVGADPEFVFTKCGKGVYAGTLGLHTALAFGADLSGRQAELRPAASRSIVTLVASVLKELRFLLVALGPTAKGLEFQAPPWDGHDGIGGHVHFGRKRQALREPEVRALDGLMRLLCKAEVFSEVLVERRTLHTNFGRFGDVREQSHGYEYRTFPSWLDSPWLAYFTLTLSKLLVLKPEFAGVPPNFGFLKAQERLRSILAYFQGMDDDARLALNALKSRGFPRFEGGDFRPRWGITNSRASQKLLWPVVMTPTSEEIEEVFHYLRGGALSYRIPTANWSPVCCREHFLPLIQSINTAGKSGFGELCWDMVFYEDFPISISYHSGRTIKIATGFTRFLPPDWKEQLKTRFPNVPFNTDSDMESHILLSKISRMDINIPETHGFLTCGVFPLWKAGTEDLALAQAFLHRNNKPTKPARQGIVSYI